MATRTRVPAGATPEHLTPGLDRSHPGRAQVVEHGVGRRHAAGRPPRGRGALDRPTGRHIGQHRQRSAVEDPPGVAQPLDQIEPGDRSGARPIEKNSSGPRASGSGGGMG